MESRRIGNEHTESTEIHRKTAAGAQFTRQEQEGGLRKYRSIRNLRQGEGLRQCRSLLDKGELNFTHICCFACEGDRVKRLVC